MSEARFLLWWNTTGRRLTDKIGLYPSRELVRDLCRIAYHQGATDNATQIAEQVTDLQSK